MYPSVVFSTLPIQEYRCPPPSTLRACASWRQCSNSLLILRFTEQVESLLFFVSFWPFSFCFLVIPDYERTAPIYFLDLYLLIIQLFSLSFSVFCGSISSLLWRFGVWNIWNMLPGTWASRGYFYLMGVCKVDIYIVIVSLARIK